MMKPLTGFLTGAIRLLTAAGLAVSAIGCSGSVEEQAHKGPPQERSEDLRGIIEGGLASGAKEIVIPPGRYRVTPKNREHLRLAGVSDVTILADGVEMLCTETTRALTIENCRNLKIRGLTIDYDPLPFTQGRIVAISEDKSRLDVEIIEGFPEPGSGKGSVEIFDPATSRLRGRVTYFSTRCEPSGPLKATLIKSNAQPDLAEQIGDIALIKAAYAPGGEIPHAIMASNCEGLTLEKMTLFASNSFGFFETGCDGSKYLECRVDRRPPGEETTARALPRLRSLNADAYHSKNAQRGPLYERCVAKFMGDDAIAINGDFHFVTRCEGATLRVLAKHQMTMRQGDEVQIFAYDGRRLENRKIVSIEPDAARSEEELRLIESQEMNEGLRKNGLAQAFLVVLDAEIAVPPGTLICSADRIGNGFVVRDCHLGFNRSRGILVKAGHGEISGNQIEGSVGTSILVSPEFWWLEAGLSDDLLISNNRISDGDGMGIAVVAVGGDRSLAPAGAFRNITIRNNTIQGGPAPGLLAASIRGLVEQDNTVETHPGKSLHPWEIGQWGRGGVQPVMKIHVE